MSGGPLRCGWPLETQPCGQPAGTVYLVSACEAETFYRDPYNAPRTHQVLALCDAHIPQTGEASSRCEHHVQPSAGASGEVEHRV